MKTFIQKTALTLTFILSIHLLHGQYISHCTNLNFSNGNLNHWTCKTASTNGVTNTAYENLTWETSPNPINGRHNIMTNIYGYDANTCNGSPNSQLSLIPDGFSKSARIGSDVASHQANAIEYEMAVDEDNALLLIHYAIVFQKGEHDSSQQARFEIRIQDSLGNLLNMPYNHYSIAAGEDSSGFIKCNSNILWKDWTTTGVSLDSFIGQTVYISISITSCNCGNHYGYAYVIGECNPSIINSGCCCHCPDIPPIATRFGAPDGFTTYEWRNSQGVVIGNYKKITILNYSDGDIFTATMTSAIGWKSTLSYRIVCDSINASFICDSTTYQCYPTKAVLTTTSTSKYSEIIYWEWWIVNVAASKTEHISYDSILNYTFEDTGYYQIFLWAFNEVGGCSTSVFVYSYPSYGKVNITAPDKICKNIETEIFASGAESYEWYNVKRITSDSSAIIDKGGTYIVRGINTLGCSIDTFIIGDKEFTIQYTKENNRCPKLSDGKINITKVVGEYDGSVSHYWEDLGFTNGAALNKRNNLLSDQYIVYSIDEDNCYRYDTIEITEPLPLGNIGKISGPFIVSNMATYTFSVSPVQGTELYHWYAYEIKESGRFKVLDTFVNKSQIDLSIVDINPIEISVRAFNFCGDTTDVSSLYIQYKSSITETSDSKHIVVYPNPISDYLTIQHKNGTLNEIRIVDVIGKEIKRQIVSGSACTLHTENLHSGIYFIQIKTESGITTTKVYKK